MIKRILLAAILLAPLTVMAAITTANDRKSAARDYVAPNASGINTQFERMAASGDFLVGGEPSSGGGGTPLHTLPVTGGG